jgi:hypothetical protein
MQVINPTEDLAEFQKKEVTDAIFKWLKPPIGSGRDGP